MISGAPGAELIERATMFGPLLNADPTFEPVWRAFLSEWGQEPELPQYLALAELARHLIAQLDRGDTSRFEAVFTVVERWHLEGEHYVREAATVGLLECLQNTGLHKGRTKPADFLEWLRPESRMWWDRLEQFWDGDTRALNPNFTLRVYRGTLRAARSHPGPREQAIEALSGLMVEHDGASATVTDSEGREIYCLHRSVGPKA